jgi:3-isopropylmalate/(R)-2-methylmalate dehydratase large subunit
MSRPPAPASSPGGVPTPRTVIDRIWDDHLVADLGGGRGLLHIDRVFLHERTGPALLAGLAAAGRAPRRPRRRRSC